MGSESAARVFNDHNVYVLGAGFSAEAGMPLIRDFMNRMRDAGSWLETQGGREREIQAIERVLEFRLKAAAASYRIPLNVENVEELFSLASASRGDELARDMAIAIAATLDFARSTAPPVPEQERFNIGRLDVSAWTKPSDWGPPASWLTQGMSGGLEKKKWFSCPPYHVYVGLISGYFNERKEDRRDTIITFNYDTIFEDNLRDLGISWDRGIPPSLLEKKESSRRDVEGVKETAVTVLKPHGSVNWAALSPEGQERLIRRLLQVEIPEAMKAGRLEDLVRRSFDNVPIRRLHEFRDYAALRTDQVWRDSVLLAPPTWQKRLGGHLAAVWDRAVEAIRTATRIVFLGYSIPATDQHVRYLLAAGLQNNISLRKVFFVNPGLAQEPTRKDLQERLFSLFRREHFDQEIIELVPKTLRDFLAGPIGLGRDEEPGRVRIGRPINEPKYSWEAAPWALVPSQGGGVTIS
jgi:hypothetical protein